MLDCSQGFVVGDDVIYQPVDQELVLLNLKSQAYYGLDPVGARMWQLLLEHGHVGPVVDCICKEYAVAESQASIDLENIIQRLLAADLLKLSEAKRV